jgi:hypothetical protein
MTEGAPALFVALEQSGFAASIRQSTWLYPAANIGHIVSLTFFAGAIAVMDVRLLGGLAATAPARASAQLCPRRARGHGNDRRCAVLGRASHLAVNRAFQLKAVLVAAGLANIAIYEFWARRAVERLQPGAPMPPGAKIAGACSLGIWVAVAACGRSIAYF